MVIERLFRRPPTPLDYDSARDQRMRQLLELNDPVLHGIIEAPTDDVRERAIEDVVSARARPLLATILARFRKRERMLRLDDCEELSSVIMLRIIKKLRATAHFEEHAIGAFDGYMAILAYNSLHDFRRQRYPERHRLKRSLRYVIAREENLAFWDTDAGPVAGLRSWKDRTDVLTTLAPDPELVTSVMTNEDRPVEAIEATLHLAGAPVVFDVLVGAMATMWNVRDLVVEHRDFPPDSRRNQLAALEQRQHLEILWDEIRELPDRQRTALLLNLRDRTDSNALALFLLLEIATEEQLAAAICVSVTELNAIWEALPLDDLQIATRLGLTRQQVINLRKSARSRLSRRMARFE